jgi:hypothetical protein
MVTRIGRRGWLLAGALLASVGCAQIFGLNDYGPENEDAGADASVGATPPEASTDGTMRQDASSDAKPPNAADAARVTDAGVDGPYFAPDACAGTNTCAPIAPPDWHGPLSIWTGSGTAPPCTNYYVPYFDGGTGLSADLAQCSCSCNPPSGATCGSASVQFGTGGCATACGSSVVVAPAVCTSLQTVLNGCASGVGATISGSTANGGTCQPNTTVVLPPAQWTTQVAACEPLAESPAGGGAGQQCVPAPTAPFQGFCIVKPGSNTCPSPFTSTHLFYADFAEGRGCSPCTCGPPTGVDCNAGAHATTWGNPTCGGTTGADITPLPVACAPVSGAHSIRLDTAPDGGACAPDGGMPTGSPSPQNITTVCCTP